MKQLLKEIRHNSLLWLLAFVPVVLAYAGLETGSLPEFEGKLLR